MSDKYTPGTWFIQEGKYYACVRTDKRVIADMRTVGNVVPNMNDARLIAAAPDLLEALKLAEEMLCKQENAMRSMGCYEPCPEVAILTAQAAIAKATGEDK